jgi:phage-related protein
VKRSARRVWCHRIGQMSTLNSLATFIGWFVIVVMAWCFIVAPIITVVYLTFDYIWQKIRAVSSDRVTGD